MEGSLQKHGEILSWQSLYISADLYQQIMWPRPFPSGHAKENQEMLLTSEGFKGSEKEAEV